MLVVSKLNIGSIYLAIDDYKNSEEWISKALNCAKDINDPNLTEKCYLNLGIVYKKKGDTAKAIASYKKGLAISESLKNLRDQAIGLQNLAILSQSGKKFKETYSYLSRALLINRELKANNSGVHTGLANLFFKEHLYDSTISHCNLAIALAKERKTKSYTLLRKNC
ncbi:MAG: hypothetical protein B6D61_06685 [Bacteroidetes bacterium 4484_249]|nr:MAG: hypothetical protein B6D61_06685 [Bacteroidetes bacterium 4484_249]